MALEKRQRNREVNMLEQFHFLRPLWLIGLLPVILIGVAYYRRRGVSQMLAGVFDEHLMKHLVVRTDAKKGIEPWHVLMVFSAILVLAMAGPSWKKEPSPFASDEAALVIVVKVTPSMLAEDIQPSRLIRTSQKIHDLLELRTGTTSSLIAYSGSPHLVMPLTKDPSVIEYFANELSPEIMPSEGDDFSEAIQLANEQLRSAGRSGSIVVFADRIAPAEIDKLDQDLTSGMAPVHFIGMGVPPDSKGGTIGSPEDAPDFESLETAAKKLGGSLLVCCPDDEDVEQLARRLQTDLVGRGSLETGQRWEDAGYWLLPVLVLLVLASFRSGWLVKWD